MRMIRTPRPRTPHSNTPRPSTSRPRTQRGETITEILVAIVIIGLVVGGLASLLATSSMSTARGNQTSRLSIALTGMGEVVKSLTYVRCADTVEYQDAFDKNENAAKLSSQQIDQGGTALTFTVVDVTGCESGVDQGTQDVTIRVGSGGSSLEATVVKRDPEPLSRDMFVVLVGTPISTAGDVLYGFQLSGEGSFSPRDIVEYRFECAADPPTTSTENPDVDGPTTIVTSDPNDPAARCVYRARSDSFDAVVTLTITDSSGVMVSATERWLVPPASSVPLAPTVTFEWTPKTITQATKTFTSTSPTPVVSPIVRWEWDFGDGSPRVSCTDGSCATTSHTYTSSGTYTAELRLTDSLGLIGVGASDPIVISIVSPTSTTPAPTTTIAPQTIEVTGSVYKTLGCYGGVTDTSDRFLEQLGTDGWWHFYFQGCVGSESVALYDPLPIPFADAFHAPTGKKCQMTLERTNGSIIATTKWYGPNTPTPAPIADIGPVADTGGWVFILGGAFKSWPSTMVWRITCTDVP